MRRLFFCLRLLAVAVAFPAILAYIVLAALLHPRALLQKGFGTPRRIWMGVWDWIKGLPVGYSYWEQFQAPTMLDEIAVHHDD